MPLPGADVRIVDPLPAFPVTSIVLSIIAIALTFLGVTLQALSYASQERAQGKDPMRLLKAFVASAKKWWQKAFALFVAGYAAFYIGWALLRYRDSPLPAYEVAVMILMFFVLFSLVLARFILKLAYEILDLWVALNRTAKVQEEAFGVHRLKEDKMAEELLALRARADQLEAGVSAAPPEKKSPLSLSKTDTQILWAVARADESPTLSELRDTTGLHNEFIRHRVDFLQKLELVKHVGAGYTVTAKGAEYLALQQ